MKREITLKTEVIFNGRCVDGEFKFAHSPFKNTKDIIAVAYRDALMFSMHRSSDKINGVAAKENCRVSLSCEDFEVIINENDEDRGILIIVGDKYADMATYFVGKPVNDFLLGTYAGKIFPDEILIIGARVSSISIQDPTKTQVVLETNAFEWMMKV